MRHLVLVTILGLLSVTLPGTALAVPEGACCTGKDGTCYVMTESDCLGFGWTYMGNGAACFVGGDPGVSVCADYGACCQADGTCDVRLRGSCEWGNEYEYLGMGSTCSPGLCVGACCNGINADSVCVHNGTRQFCWWDEGPDGLKGQWGGYFTECDSVCSYLGACCTEADSCWITTEYVCSTVFRDEWHGVDVPCSPDPCNPVGACCYGNGTCQVLLEPNCIGVSWEGIGTVCDPNPCPQPTQEDLDGLDRRRRLRKGG